MLPPDYRILTRMGLPEDLASIYSKAPDSPFRKALEDQLQIKNWLKALQEMNVLTAEIKEQVVQSVDAALSDAQPKARKRAA